MNKFSFKLNKRGIVILLLVFAVLSSLTIFSAYGKYTANGTVTDSISLNVISKMYILEPGPQFNTHVINAGLCDATKIIFGRANDYIDIVNACASPIIVDSEKKGTIKLYWDTNKTTAFVLSDGKIMANPNSSSMFLSLNATDLQPDNISTSLATNMSQMFAQSGFTSLVLDWMDTSNVTDMSYMFRGAKCSSLNMDTFDTSRVTTMKGMFRSISNIPVLSIPESFDTSSVTDMSEMFFYVDCTSINFPNTFNTSNVTTMAEMFSYAKKLASLDLSSFNTEKVTTMQGMFAEMNITSLDLHSFSNASLTNCSQMFSYCYNLKSIHLCGFSSKQGMNIYRMFFRVADNGSGAQARIYTQPGMSIAGTGTGDSSAFYCAKIIGPKGKTETYGYYDKWAKQASDGYFTACSTHKLSSSTTSSFSVVIDTTNFGNMTASQTD